MSSRKSKTLPGFKDTPEFSVVQTGTITALGHFADYIFYGSRKGILSLFKLNTDHAKVSKNAEAFRMMRDDPILQVEAASLGSNTL